MTGKAQWCRNWFESAGELIRPGQIRKAPFVLSGGAKWTSPDISAAECGDDRTWPDAGNGQMECDGEPPGKAAASRVEWFLFAADAASV